jgi:hypothetical protein
MQIFPLKVTNINKLICTSPIRNVSKHLKVVKMHKEVAKYESTLFIFGQLKFNLYKISCYLHMENVQKGRMDNN